MHTMSVILTVSNFENLMLCKEQKFRKGYAFNFVVFEQDNYC